MQEQPTDLLPIHSNYLNLTSLLEDNNEQEDDWLYNPNSLSPLQKSIHPLSWLNLNHQQSSSLHHPPPPPPLPLPSTPFPFSHDHDLSDSPPLNLDSLLEDDFSFWNPPDSPTDPEEVVTSEAPDVITKTLFDVSASTQLDKTSPDASPTTVTPASRAFTILRSSSTANGLATGNGKRLPSALPRPQTTAPVRTTTSSTPQTAASRLPLSVVSGSSKNGLQTGAPSDSVMNPPTYAISPLTTPTRPRRPIAPLLQDGKHLDTLPDFKSRIPYHPQKPPLQEKQRRSHKHGVNSFERLLSLALVLWCCSLAYAATSTDEAGSRDREIASDRLLPFRTSEQFRTTAAANSTVPSTTSAKTLETSEPPVVVNPDDVRPSDDDVPTIQDPPLTKSEHHIIVFLAIFGSILGAGFVAGIAYLILRQNGANRRRKALETCGIKPRNSHVLLQTRRPSNVSMSPPFRDGRDSWSLTPPFRDRRDSRSTTASFRDHRRESPSHNLDGATTSSNRSPNDPSLRKYSIPEFRYAASSYESARDPIHPPEPERLRDRPRTLPPGSLDLLPPMPSYQPYNAKTRQAGGPDHSQLLAATPRRKYSR